MLGLFVVACCLTSDPTDTPGEAPPIVKAYLEAAEASRLAAIEGNKETIKRFAGNPGFKKEVAAAKKDLAALKAGKLPVPELPFKATAGAVGSIPEGEILVVEILSPTEAVVELKWIPDASTVGAGKVVFQGKSYPAEFLLRGVDTSAWADDRRVELPGVFEVGAAGDTGGRKLFVLKPFDLAQVEPFLPKPKKGAKAVKKPAR